MKKTIAVSGGFDPVHVGHIRLFREASIYGELVVILNTDDFLIQKKGYVFMPLRERKEVLESIRYVSWVFVSVDSDMTVCRSLETLRPNIFANGGDRGKGNVPESEVCDRLGIEMLYGIGGTDKPQSSSWLVKGVR
jgi:D-beta-D-heptose 7-phosphate kinase/D-beta-D-heptose 1-phosphate adenosyltransferase